MTWTQTTDETLCARRTLWTFDRWRVVHSVSLFGLTPRYYALEMDTRGCWQLLRRCRAEGSAWRAVHRAIKRATRAARREAKLADRRKHKRRQAERRRYRRLRGSKSSPKVSAIRPATGTVSDRLPASQLYIFPALTPEACAMR